MRHDLLRLTPADLIALSNRGLVRRAEREVAQAKHAATFAHDGDTLTVTWSDGATCVFPAGQPLAAATCTCAAAGLCRHRIRSVLAYAAAHEPSGATPSADPPQDPGAITDADLAGYYTPQALTALRRAFDAGLVVALQRGRRPSARFLTQGVTVRFIVPGAPAYADCDCREPAPCRHVALAVWAFRRLASDAGDGLVETRAEPLPVPHATLDAVHTALADLLATGVGDLTAAQVARLEQLAARCASGGLLWPADLLAALVMARTQYVGRDARYDPNQVQDITGELILRLRAIRRDTPGVPAVYVRGSETDRATPIDSATYTGIGCEVQPVRGGARLLSYLQDATTGETVVLARFVADPVDRAPAAFADLGRRRAVAGTPFAELGRSRLLLKGGTRAGDRTLRVGRAPAAVSPQPALWEALRPPLVATDFAAVAAQLAGQPPRSLRPRHAGADLSVIPVTAVEQVTFDDAAQTVVARLRDVAGDEAWLTHPHFSRGAAGCEALLGRLTARGDRLRQVAGHAQRLGDRLLVRPVALRFESADGATLVQPWIDPWEGPPALTGATDAGLAAADPRLAYPRALREALGRLWTGGILQAGAPTVRAWRRLAAEGDAAGFVRLTAAVDRLAQALAAKPHDPAWRWEPAAEAALALSALVRLAVDL